MSLYLKQNTAVVISFGPFVDPTDGVTLVTGLISALDHASTGIKLSKNGGAQAVRHASVTASTYAGYGDYLVTLDTTDTNTLGAVRMSFAAAASCLPVWQDFQVVPANVWDALVGGSVGLKVDVETIKTNSVVNGGTITFPTNATLPTAAALDDLPTNAELATALGTAADPMLAAIAVVQADTDNIQTRIPTSLVSGRIDASVGAMAAGVVTAAAVATGAIDADAIATDAVTEIQSGLATAASLSTALTNIDALPTTSELATALDSADDAVLAAIPSAASIADAVWDEATSGHTTSGTFGEQLKTDVDAILVDTGTTLDALIQDLTTNAELATALAAADDAILAAIAALNNLSQANVRTAVGLGSANLDTQLDALPTAIENADALLKRDWSSVTGEASRSLLNALRAIRNKWSVTGGTLTITKEDDLTSAWTATVVTTASDPVSSVDPA